MTVTAKDLRFNISMIFDVLSKGEDVLITYRGKAKAKLIAYNQPSSDKKTDTIFGMWQDREEDVETMVRNMRQGRNFGI
jgi:antitoxin (DNA-binding transcriptional repressor) of toxin-antitoxin stability system